MIKNYNETEVRSSQNRDIEALVQKNPELFLNFLYPIMPLNIEFVTTPWKSDMLTLFTLIF